MATEPTEPTESAGPTEHDWTIDELTARTGVPVRTIREYQRLGLLPPPRRVGRIGVYDDGHRQRLELIGRLQARGYSLAGIADLLTAWRDGAAIGDVLGLEPDQLVHVDEPGAPATIDVLTDLLPGVVPDRLDSLIDTGLIELCGPDRYCIPSPSLLQLTIDILATGVDVDAALALLRSIGSAADGVAEAVLATVAEVPASVDDDTLTSMIGRGRGLLAHGVGRLTVHRLGRRLGAGGEESTPELSERLRSRVRG